MDRTSYLILTRAVQLGLQLLMCDISQHDFGVCNKFHDHRETYQKITTLAATYIYRYAHTPSQEIYSAV